MAALGRRGGGALTGRARARIDRFGWLRDRPGRPLAIAHRGASHWAPDNSLAAFAAAARLGADLWEVDVRTARDGTLVVAHDAEVTAGDGHRVALAEHGSAEIGSLTEGAVPRFDEVLALAAATGSGVYVDAKDAAAAALAPARLRAHGIERAVIAAFATDALRALAERDVGYPLAVLVGRGADPFEMAARGGADILHLSRSWADHADPPLRVAPALLARARAAGLAVVLWREEGGSRVDAMRALPVLGTCSNRPELLRRYVPDPAAGRPGIVCRGGASGLLGPGTRAGASADASADVSSDTAVAAHVAFGAGYGLAFDVADDEGGGGGGAGAFDEVLELAAEHDAELHVDLAGGDARDVVARVRAAGHLERCTFGSGALEDLHALRATAGDAGPRLRLRMGHRDVATLADALAFPGVGLVELDARSVDAAAVAACRSAGRETMVTCAQVDAATLRRALDSGTERIALDRPCALRRRLEADWPDGEAVVTPT